MKLIKLFTFCLLITLTACASLNTSPSTSVKTNFDNLHKSARQGDAEAQATLGHMYLLGENVEQDYEKAFEWSTKAAKQGDKDAQFALAFMYTYGKGVRQNDAKAFEYCLKAGKQGHAEALNNVGVMYALGEGVQENMTKAYTCFILANALGHEHVKENLKRAESFLSTEEKNKAEAEAKEMYNALPK